MRPQIRTLPATLWRPAAAAVRSSPRLAGFLSLTALTNVTILVLNLGGGIVQARGLGPEGRGELTIAMLWPGLIAGLGGLGLAESVAYHTARESSGRSRVLATALAIGVPQTLALLLIGWNLLPIVLHGKPPQILSQTRFYLWFLPLVPLTLYPQAYLQGRLAMGSFNALLLCTSAVSTALLAVLWVAHALTVQSALVAWLASWAISVALSFGILFRRRDWGWRANPRLVRPLLWFGVRRQVGHLAVLVLQQRLDLIVLSVVLPAAALGTYAVATSAGTVASTFPLAASYVLYPAFARQTAAELPFAMARLLLTGGLLTLAAGPPLLLLPPLALPYVYGHAFASARLLAAVLGLGYFVRGWNGLLAAVIAASGRPFTATIGQIVEFAAFVPMLAILIPRFGMTGGATAVLLGAATSLVCLLVSALIITRLTPRRLAVLWAHQIRSWRQLSVAGRVTGPGGLES